MERLRKVKDWINENAPMLNTVYQNKYVGMVYDRFASLPTHQQKQVILGVFGSGISIIVLVILFSYLSLWSSSRRASQAYQMVTLLQQYQKFHRDKSGIIQQLEKNARLANPGEFKQHLMGQARAANISQRMIEVNENSNSSMAEPKTSDAKLIEARVSLQRVNLQQLKSFLQNVEFGNYNLSVSSLRIKNDEKVRGYMNAELGIVAYLFQSEEST